MVKLILDENSPQYKAAVAKRKAAEDQERQDAQQRAERAEAMANREKEKEERRRVLTKAADDARAKVCPGSAPFGVKAGMKPTDVMFCLDAIDGGRPDRINTTTTALGQQEQWIYRISDKNMYIYFTNGVVTAIQH